MQNNGVTVTAPCPSGKRVVGGGMRGCDCPGFGIQLNGVSSAPSASGESWVATCTCSGNPSGTPTVVAVAICAAR
jgi:hypothetical protein